MTNQKKVKETRVYFPEFSEILKELKADLSLVFEVANNKQTLPAEKQNLFGNICSLLCNIYGPACL